jgi:hypothetical protein
MYYMSAKKNKKNLYYMRMSLGIIYFYFLEKKYFLEIGNIFGYFFWKFFLEVFFGNCFWKFFLEIFFGNFFWKFYFGHFFEILLGEFCLDFFSVKTQSVA